MRRTTQLTSMLAMVAVASLVGAGAGLPRAVGQEPLHAPSATQPAPGDFIFKEQFRYVELEDDDHPRQREVQQFEAWSTLHAGLATDLAMTLKAPLLFRRVDEPGRRDRDTAQGLGDLTALIKWRAWRHDSGPIDTQRLSLLAGMSIRSGDDGLSSDAYAPILGAAYTQINGRHGLNLAGQWRFTLDGRDAPIYPGQGQADLLSLDAAYAYRIEPAMYSADTRGAWYGLFELTGRYETNGDYDLLLGPGLMYEAERWVLELGVQLPATQDVSHRPEFEYAVIVGLRFLL